MGAISISGCTELAEALAEVLPLKHKLFAVQVASGLSYRESARRVGYHEDHGHRLMRKPAVKARVEQLRDAPEEERIRAGIEAELPMLYNRTANGDLRNVQLRLQVAMAYLKFLASVDQQRLARTSVSRLGKIGCADFDAMLERELPALDPGAREILKRIAAGEDDAAGSVAENITR